MKYNIIGIDLAKNIFHLHGAMIIFRALTTSATFRLIEYIHILKYNHIMKTFVDKIEENITIVVFNLS